MGFFLTLSLPVAAAAQAAATGKPDEAPADDRSVTDIEIMLQLRAAEKNVDRLLGETELAGSNRIEPQFDAKRLAELKQALDELLTRIDATIANDKVETLRREQANLKKLSVLYEAVKVDRPAYEKRFNDCVEQLLADTKNLDTAQQKNMEAYIRAYRILDRYIDQRESEDTVLAVLEDYVKTYPNSHFGLQLYLNRAENLLQIGDVQGAKRVYEVAQEVCRANPRSAIIPSLLKRIDMVGQRCEISGPTSDGGQYDIANDAGKVVLVDFWASWCGPCIEQIPKLRKLYAKYRDHGLAIVGVSLDDPGTAPQETKARFSNEWPQIVPAADGPTGFDSPLAVKFEVHKIPDALLVDKQGNLLGSGYRNLRQLEYAIVAALGLPAPLPDPPSESAPAALASEESAPEEPAPSQPEPANP